MGMRRRPYREKVLARAERRNAAGKGMGVMPDTISRRTVLRAMFGAVGLVALAGCGGKSPTAQPAARATATAPGVPATATPQTTPRTSGAPAATAVAGASQAQASATTVSATSGAQVPATPASATLPAVVPATPRAASASPAAGPVAVTVRAIATGLDTPWSLAFAPDGRLFFTERGGRLRVIEGGQVRELSIAALRVQESGESGLMGLALDPQFPAEPYLYLMYTGGQSRANRIVRLRLTGDTLQEERALLDGLPSGTIHDGGRVKFGPDGKLYATLGDTSDSKAPQNPAALAGKIFRLERDGAIPADNPIPGSPVYSLGHRNPQGLAWQPGTGRLYETEHGPTGNDEVNLIEAGANYGWPDVQGPNHPAPFRSPLAVYTPSVAPAGATFYDAAAIPQWRGSFFFGALRGVHLHRLTFDASDPRRVLADERLYEGEYGRLRDVVQGPDGALYVTTSNRDGRGSPVADDDRILRIGPA